MNIISLTAIAIGLAMDAFAVALTSGITIKKMRLHHAIQISATFGIFQAVMPIIGWSLTNIAADYICAYDHWLAFFLLSGIGIKMIYEAKFESEAEKETNPLKIYVLFSLAIATSLDALVIGITFSLLHITIIFPVLFIGAITFILSLLGVYLGKKFGNFFDASKVEIAGGIILIIIGLKILIESLI